MSTGGVAVAQAAPDAAAGLPPAAAALLRAWDQANADLIAGMVPVTDVGVADELAPVPEGAGLWGGPLPDNVPAGLEPGLLRSLVRQAGYLTDEGTGLERLDACRALVLPDRSCVSSAEASRVRALAEAGGAVLAFAHASLPAGRARWRDDYALADLFGAHYEGPVRFETEATRVTTACSSIWSPQFVPENIINGRPDEFWASLEGGPLPQWVEIRFAQPHSVARALVQCRPGFLLQDLDLQCQVNAEWVTAAEVRNNEGWSMDCPFAQPLQADAVRVVVSRESLNGEDRQIADVGEVTLFDEVGRRLIAPPYLVEVEIEDVAWSAANRADRLVLRCPAVRLRPAGAQVLATFADPLSGERLPFCTRQQCGQGRAYLLAAPEGALGTEPESWEPLLRAFLGMPTVRHSGDEAVVACVRRRGDRWLVQVVDTQPPDTPDRAHEVIVRINQRATGKVREVLSAPEGTPLATKGQDEWLQFTAPMAPLASVLLRTR